MIKHTFKVAKSEGATQHDVTVNVRTFDEATEAQRRAAWDEAQSSIRIKVQGTLRRRLKAGVKPGADLDREAQAAWDAAAEGRRVASTSLVIDAAEMGLTREQIDMFVAKGATVVNIPAKLAK